MKKDIKGNSRCNFCGKYFRINIRGRKRKHCGAPECKHKTKLEAQHSWSKRNPDYFTGRYEYLKQWRQKNPKYQMAWRKGRRAGEIQEKKDGSNRVLELRFILPAEKIKCEIQEKMIFERQSGGVYRLTGQMTRDTRKNSQNEISEIQKPA